MYIEGATVNVAGAGDKHRNSFCSRLFVMQHCNLLQIGESETLGEKSEVINGVLKRCIWNIPRWRK